MEATIMPDLKEKNRIILKNSKMHELWDLGAPTILEQALQTIVAYVDTAMVGPVSYTHLDVYKRQGFKFRVKSTCIFKVTTDSSSPT